MSLKPFLMAASKAFRVETRDATVIVTPADDLERYRYHDVHCDVGRIHDLLSRPEFENVVVDLEWRFFGGMVLVDAMTAFCRGARNRAAHCRVSDEMAMRLAELKLGGLWPVYSSVEDALASFHPGAGRKPCPPEAFS